MPTDGEPAMVGRWLRLLRREESDCFCNELIVCDVARDPVIEGVLTMLEEDEEDEPGLTLLNRSVVEGGKAVSCIGGRTMGFGFF